MCMPTMLAHSGRGAPSLAPCGGGVAGINAVTEWLTWGTWGHASCSARACTAGRRAHAGCFQRVTMALTPGPCATDDWLAAPILAVTSGVPRLPIMWQSQASPHTLQLNLEDGMYSCNQDLPISKSARRPHTIILNIHTGLWHALQISLARWLLVPILCLNR